MTSQYSHELLNIDPEDLWKIHQTLFHSFRQRGHQIESDKHSLNKAEFLQTMERIRELRHAALIKHLKTKGGGHSNGGNKKTKKGPAVATKRKTQYRTTSSTSSSSSSPKRKSLTTTTRIPTKAASSTTSSSQATPRKPQLRQRRASTLHTIKEEGDDDDDVGEEDDDDDDDDDVSEEEEEDHEEDDDDDDDDEEGNARTRKRPKKKSKSKKVAKVVVVEGEDDQRDSTTSSSSSSTTSSSLQYYDPRMSHYEVCLTFTTTSPSLERSIVVFASKQVGVKGLKEFRTFLDETQQQQQRGNFSRFRDIVMVMSQGFTAFAGRELAKLKEHYRLRPYLHSDLMSDLTQHRIYLLSPYTKIDEKEKREMMHKHSIADEEHLSRLLPCLNARGPASLYWDFAEGDIVRIDRQGSHPEYRYVTSIQ